MLGSAISLKLISGEIIFEVFQLNVTDKLTQTDGERDRQTTYCGITALLERSIAR